LSEYLKKYFKKAKLIHSGDAIVELLKEKYGLFSKSNTDIQFLASENPIHLKEVAKKWIKEIK
jgi:glutamate racemase